MLCTRNFTVWELSQRRPAMHANCAWGNDGTKQFCKDLNRRRSCSSRQPLRYPVSNPYRGLKVIISSLNLETDREPIHVKLEYSIVICSGHETSANVVAAFWILLNSQGSKLQEGRQFLGSHPKKLFCELLALGEEFVSKKLVKRHLQICFRTHSRIRCKWWKPIRIAVAELNPLQ